jgi:branched-chain amino acid transport system substrate-binding protein
MNVTRRALGACAAALLAWLCVPSGASAQSSNPIRVGMSLALTGAGAPAGKMLQAAIEIWRDDVNAKGGLLGRPVEIIVYDDQSNPASVPGLYTKLISVDKADLLVGPYGTNFVAPAMPTIIQNKKMLISYTAIGINREYNYDKYFSMVPVGSDGVNAFSKGFFELAAAAKPKPETVAILAADAEFAQAAATGAREELKKHGFKLVYDKSYPPATTDFAPVVRAVQAANADIVFIGAYPPDNVGIVRAANEVGLNPKMFGGAMIGMLITPIKVQLGPVTNGLVIAESFISSPKLNFVGLDDLMKRYQVKAGELKTDALGYAFVPFGYAAGQMLHQAVTETKSLDHDVLAKYIHANTFKTVVGDLSFGKDGEWSKPRELFTQFQNVEPNNLDQFRSGAKQPILWPPEYKTGDMIYPYADARKK